MYPAPFEYHRAGSVDEALDLLAEHGEAEAELLAGGHALLPDMKRRRASPDVVIDVGRIDALSGVRRDGDATTVGTLTNYADVVDDDGLDEVAPALTEAAGAIGDVQVRNMGTVGGNLAAADPESDLPGAVLASEATIYAEGPDGERAIDAEDFFVGPGETALGPDELLTRIEVPHLGPGDAGAYVKKPAPTTYVMVGVAAVVRTDGERVESARVAANGVFDHARRLEPVEDALEGEPPNPDLAGEAAANAVDDVPESALLDDVHTSSDARARLLEAYTERALEAALDRAG